MITVKRKIQLARRTSASQRRATLDAAPPASVPAPVPRISRLMAIALRLERMLQTGEVSDIHDLARLGHVTQPRISQILALTLLAPDIQEELLFLPRVSAGKSAIHEKMLRPISAEIDWAKQRAMWVAIDRSSAASIQP